MVANNRKPADGVGFERQVRVRRHSFRSVLVLVLLTGPAANRAAEACSCMAMANAPCFAAGHADAVFIATAVDQGEEHVGGHLYRIVQTLAVTRTLRGTFSPLVTMVSYNPPGEKEIAASLSQDKVWAGTNSCDYHFRRGEEYLVYATRTSDGRWTTSLCSGTKPLADARADLDYFASLPGAEPTGRLYGSIDRTILDADDPTKTLRVPAPGITVALSAGSTGFTATTDAEGKLAVPLPPGDYSVAPVVPESVRVYGGPRQISLARSGCAEVTFSLTSNGRIEGRVVRNDGAAVPRVAVGVIPVTTPEGERPDNFTTAPSTRSDEHGQFKIEAILPGTYLLAVNPGFGPDLQSPYATTYYPAGGRREALAIDIGDGERKTDYTIAVTPLTETNILGRVVFNDGNPVAGAGIVIYPADAPGHVVSTATTDGSGTFRLRALAGVMYLIRAGTETARGYRQTETQVFVREKVDDVRISIRR